MARLQNYLKTGGEVLRHFLKSTSETVVGPSGTACQDFGRRSFGSLVQGSVKPAQHRHLPDQSEALRIFNFALQRNVHQSGSNAIIKFSKSWTEVPTNYASTKYMRASREWQRSGVSPSRLAIIYQRGISYLQFPGRCVLCLGPVGVIPTLPSQVGAL